MEVVTSENSSVVILPLYACEQLYVYSYATTHLGSGTLANNCTCTHLLVCTFVVAHICAFVDFCIWTLVRSCASTPLHLCTYTLAHICIIRISTSAQLYVSTYLLHYDISLATGPVAIMMQRFSLLRDPQSGQPDLENEAPGETE